MSGGGHVTLSSANTYTGGTVVNSGTIEIASANARPSGKSLTIASGGTVVLSSGLGATGASAVPEPSTLALLGIGAVGLLTCGWRRW